MVEFSADRRAYSRRLQQCVTGSRTGQDQQPVTWYLSPPRGRTHSLSLGESSMPSQSSFSWAQERPRPVGRSLNAWRRSASHGAPRRFGPQACAISRESGVRRRGASRRSILPSPALDHWPWSTPARSTRSSPARQPASALAAPTSVRRCACPAAWPVVILGQGGAGGGGRFCFSDLTWPAGSQPTRPVVDHHCVG